MKIWKFSLPIKETVIYTNTNIDKRVVPKFTKYNCYCITVYYNLRAVRNNNIIFSGVSWSFVISISNIEFSLDVCWVARSSSLLLFIVFSLTTCILGVRGGAVNTSGIATPCCGTFWLRYWSYFLQTLRLLGPLFHWSWLSSLFLFTFMLSSSSTPECVWSFIFLQTSSRSTSELNSSNSNLQRFSLELNVFRNNHSEDLRSETIVDCWAYK